MAKTTTMRLMELMIYKEDIETVLKYLGSLGQFQFQQDFSDRQSEKGSANAADELFARLTHARAALSIPDISSYTEPLALPTEEDNALALKIINETEALHKKEVYAQEEAKRVSAAYNEALSFSNLKVSYSDLETLSFLTMRIGKIDPAVLGTLTAAIGERGVVVHLGTDKSRIMVACSKKARFFVDSELKKAGFVELQVPTDFKGVPDDMLASLEEETKHAAANLAEIQTERKNFAETHKAALLHLLQVFSVQTQITQVKSKLESTEFVYRITGWLPAYLTHDMMKDLDNMTQGRCGIREFLPSEVSAVLSGQEQVPVKLKHGKLISAFERMIFSYGAPLYGSVDPTPFVAIFFTLLFGIMFGDAGQGLVFLILGILMSKKLLKLGGWEKFGLIFICIGVSSTIMGILTGEFFANEEILAPVSRFITGIFGEPHHPILHMMPSSNQDSITRMFLFFGFTVAVGFVINTTGLIINIINQFALKRLGKAIFGKTGLVGALFFWYVVIFAVRIAFFGHAPAVYDWIIIFATLLLAAFGEPLARVVDKERPILENGLFAAIIAAVVEIIEIVSSYLSNTVSFLRVGAFALAHAVLGFIINMMAGIVPSPWGIVVSIIGNAIVVVLEGMIVAIQVVRLQYYEFFSKFFSETGREFKPFAFTYTGGAL